MKLSRFQTLPAVSLLLASFLHTAGSPGFAQAPKITSLYPGGLQRGTTAEISLNGKAGKTPLTAVALDQDQLQLTVSEKGDKLTVISTEQTRPGLHWIRLNNDEGSNKILPLHVGVLSEILEKEPNNFRQESGEPLALPVVMNGMLNKGGEIDLFPVRLAAGETLIASLDALRSLGSPMDAALQLSDANGFVVAHNDDDHGFDPLISWTAPAEGIYFVRVFAFPSAPNSSIAFAGGGDYVYRLTLTTGPFLAASGVPDKQIPHIGWGVDALSADRVLMTPGLHLLPLAELQAAWRSAQPVVAEPLTLPAAVRGVMNEEKSSEQVSVALKKGESIRVRVHARGLDSLLDPVLEIREGDKLHKAFDDIRKDLLDIDITWKAPGDGEFSLVVSDRYEHSGPRYFYLLQVEKEQPRLDLTVSQEFWIGKADQALDIPVTISRLSGFAEPVKFRIEGLTDQQTLEAPVSEAKGDSAKAVTLKITNSAPELFQGPVRIIAEWGPDGSTQNQAITAGLILPGYTTDQLWLTLPGSTKKVESPQAK